MEQEIEMERKKAHIYGEKSIDPTTVTRSTTVGTKGTTAVWIVIATYLRPIPAGIETQYKRWSNNRKKIIPTKVVV